MYFFFLLFIDIKIKILGRFLGKKLGSLSFGFGFFFDKMGRGFYIFFVYGNLKCRVVFVGY